MSTPTVKPKAMIQDNTRCIGCRACMVACKSWNDLPDDKTISSPAKAIRTRAISTPTTIRSITFNEIVAAPTRLGVRASALHALRTARLRVGVPDDGDVQNGSRPRGVR